MPIERKQIGLRLSPELAGWVKEKADAENRTVNNWIEHVLLAEVCGVSRSDLAVWVNKVRQDIGPGQITLTKGRHEVPIPKDEPSGGEVDTTPAPEPVVANPTPEIARPRPANSPWLKPGVSTASVEVDEHGIVRDPVTGERLEGSVLLGPVVPRANNAGTPVAQPELAESEWMPPDMPDPVHRAPRKRSGRPPGDDLPELRERKPARKRDVDPILKKGKTK